MGWLSVLSGACPKHEYRSQQYFWSRHQQGLDVFLLLKKLSQSNHLDLLMAGSGDCLVSMHAYNLKLPIAGLPKQAHQFAAEL